MTKVDISTAQQQLFSLFASAMAGDDVVVMGPDGQEVRLVPVDAQPPYRKAGTAQGQIRLSPDFDAELSDFSEYSP